MDWLLEKVRGVCFGRDINEMQINGTAAIISVLLQFVVNVVEI